MSKTMCQPIKNFAARFYRSGCGVSTCSQCFYNRGIRPSDLTSCSLWGLQDSQGGNLSYSTVSFKLSLLKSQRQYWSVPERQGSSSSAEVYTGITFWWSMSQRTEARQRADGCMVWPDSGQLRRQANKQWRTGGRHTGVKQQSDGKQQQRIQTGILARRIRRTHGSPGQQ